MLLTDNVAIGDCILSRCEAFSLVLIQRCCLIHLRIGEAELKQMVPIDPDELRQQLEGEVNRTHMLDMILHSLGQLREVLRPVPAAPALRKASVSDPGSEPTSNNTHVVIPSNNSNASAVSVLNASDLTRCIVNDGEGCNLPELSEEDEF